MARGILRMSGNRNYGLRDFRSLPQHGQASAMTILEWNRPKLAACPPPTTVRGPIECVWFTRHLGRALLFSARCRRSIAVNDTRHQFLSAVDQRRS
jgi:hypothetical protein